MKDSKVRKSEDISVLISQVGYHNNDIKKAYIRSFLKDPKGLPKTFQLRDSLDNRILLEKEIVFWGEKWGSYWWVMDFSAIIDDGTYHIFISGELSTNLFQIRDDILTNSKLNAENDRQVDIIDIAIKQLDGRLTKFEEINFKIEGVEGEYIPGYRDCGSEIRELSSHIVTLHGLLDVFENKKIYEGLSQSHKKELLDKISWTADYIVFSQEHSDNPFLNGRFSHDAVGAFGKRNTLRGIIGWHSWHDSAYAITALVRAYTLVSDLIPCEKYFNSAKLAYENACFRMYNLDIDLSIPTDHDGNNPSKGSQKQNVVRLAKQVYDAPDDWEIPQELKTKDKLTFLWACTLFYKATKEDEYLETAILFADSAAQRQFTDWENPIEGVYGNFYAFENDNEKFTLEWNQNGQYHMGNIEPTNLKGYIDLIELLPNHKNSVKWYNVIKTYGENYLKKTAKLSPFGIYPLTIYSNQKHGGVKYFQVTNHGATGMYGQIAKNIMEIARFLEDAEYQTLASNNLQFVAGLNPGIPTTYEEGKWESKSLIAGLGANYFGAKHGAIGVILSLKEAPLGSGVNGFSADVQFRPTNLGTVLDAPKGIINMNRLYQYNEDYLPHSQGYVSGVTEIEKCPRVLIKTKMHNKNINARVKAIINNKEFLHNCDGQLIMENLPTQKEVEITATYKDMALTEKFFIINGMEKEINFDFGTAVSMAISVPEEINTQDNKGRVTITNLTQNILEAKLDLYSYGVDIKSESESEFQSEFESKTETETETKTVRLSLKPRKPVQYNFDIAAGYKTMPYTIKGVVEVGGNKYVSYGEGKVQSISIRDQREYLIKVESSHGGYTNHTGETIVKEGSTFTLIITPDEGYEISDVIVDGVSMGSIASYIIADSKENHKINVHFTRC